MKVILMIAAILLPYASAVGEQNAVDVELTDHKVSLAADAVNTFFKSQNADEETHDVVKVISATKQLVSGMLYRLKLKMSNHQICDVQVLEQLWMEQKYTTTVDQCKREEQHTDKHEHKSHGAEGHKGRHGHTEAHKQDHLLGGEKEADLSNPRVQKALAAVTDRINQESNSMFRVIPSGGKITVQVVNGLIIRFKEMDLKVTTCRKNADTMGKFTAEECPINTESTSNHGTFNAKVYWNRKTFEIQDLDILT